MVKKSSFVNKISLTSVSSRLDRDNMNILHNFAEDILKYYITLLDFYPHDSLTIYAGNTDCFGGFPNGKGQITIHNISTYTEDHTDWWKWIIAHEIGHMYWGYYVLDGNKKPNSELGWLTIGLGLFLDRKYSIDNCIQHTEYAEMFEEYDKAIEYHPNIDFNMDSKYTNTRIFDYNYAINHGKALKYILEKEKSLTANKFWKFYKSLLSIFANKNITQTDFELLFNKRLMNDNQFHLLNKKIK
ncbi:hypothetical protein JW887_06250 [Candidatus Dojkabacteria bacterium]|nr:hypothetical protein [Candidatus Dojkabacteria bacterium]